MQKRWNRWVCSTCLLLFLLAPIIGFAEWHKEYEEALDLIKKGRYGEAIPALQRVVREKDREGANIEFYGMKFGDYFPYYYLGKAYFYQQNYESAIEHFDRSQQQGEIQKKRDLYRNLTDLRSLAAAQVSLAAQKSMPQAPASPAREDPSSQEPKSEEALLPEPSKEQSNMEESGPGQASISSKQPQNIPADSNKDESKKAAKEGARRYFLGDIDGAITAMNRAITLDPENASAQFLLGCCFATKYLLSGSKDQNFYESAFSAFQKAKRMNLNSPITKSPYISPAVLEIFEKVVA